MVPEWPMMCTPRPHLTQPDCLQYMYMLSMVGFGNRASKGAEELVFVVGKTCKTDRQEWVCMRTRACVHA